MRKLSDTFMAALKSGFLSPVMDRVRTDPDLNLEIRQDYINLYFKGHSLAKITERTPSRYKLEIHEKFLEGVCIPAELVDQEMTAAFLSSVPRLKDNIGRYAGRSIEIEYEQMIIRANNYEPHSNTDYFVIDRQYTTPEGRFDLVGFYWDSRHRIRYQEVSLCLIEVKFALNRDISEVHTQFDRYYHAVKPRAPDVAAEFEGVFRQKLELELYRQPQDRLDAMKTLGFSKEISHFQFILVLVDYNPNSGELHLEPLAHLPFASQVRILRGGFGLWQAYLERPDANTPLPRN